MAKYYGGEELHGSTDLTSCTYQSRLLSVVGVLLIPQHNFHDVLDHAERLVQA